MAFGGFAIYNIFQALSGSESCGCLGTLAIHPWYMAAFATSLVSALLIDPPTVRNAPAPRALRWKSAGVVLLAGLVVFAVLLANAVRPAAPPTYGLIADAYTHDFGTLKQGEGARVEHVFALRNTSDRPIRIVKSSSTCGCTVAEVPKEAVAPGATALVRVKADWSQRPGRQTEQVRLTTDHSATGVVTLSVSGEVEGLVFSSPATIHFGAVRRGTSASRVIRVASSPISEFQIRSVEKSSELLHVTRLNADGRPDPSLPLAGPRGSFEIAFRPLLASRGVYSARVVFHTNSPGAARLEVPINAQVAESFDVTPSALLFTNNEEKELKQLRISAPKHVGADPPTVEFLMDSAEPGLFHVETLRMAGEPEMPTWVCNVGSRPVARSGLHRSTLRVRFGSEFIDVPVVAIRP